MLLFQWFLCVAILILPHGPFVCLVSGNGTPRISWFYGFSSVLTLELEFSLFSFDLYVGFTAVSARSVFFVFC